MIAIIKTGGKQYLVEEGQRLKIEKLEKEVGDKVEFEALLVSNEDGSDAKVGTPIVSGAKVTAEVLEQDRADKVFVIKFKSKSNYRRKNGHRQPYTLVKIEKISA
ncbi:MAG: 50S ribosomal protein L21 [bacterium]|nr:50S ribosomal protein L21 [bacterium]MDA1024512.1 50S ribosomal protein L21 [bacterium]